MRHFDILCRQSIVMIQRPADKRPAKERPDRSEWQPVLDPVFKRAGVEPIRLDSMAVILPGERPADLLIGKEELPLIMDSVL